MHNLNIDEKLPITLEKRIQRKEISFGDEKGTSVLYTDIVTPSIGKEIIAETSQIGKFVHKSYEQMALNNLKKSFYWE